MCIVVYFNKKNIKKIDEDVKKNFLIVALEKIPIIKLIAHCTLYSVHTLI